MLRKISIGLLSALIAQQVAVAQQSDSLEAAAQAAAAAFDNPVDPAPPVPPPAEPLPVPAGDAAAGVAVDAASAEVPGNGEILVTGPLHEAYAEQFTAEPMPGLVVSKQPPEAIEEIPPEYRPDGHNVAWIPGYWGWDADRDDFVWITGIWRQTPPGRSWIPGYWAEVPDGFQWISGFWAAATEEEIVYLPAPPQPIEAAPSSDPPGDNYFWVPGQWAWIDNDYQWRAGYWAEAYPDWVWVPERYVYTPVGYVYRAGYWDYVLTDRGTIFCPVYWSQPVATYRLRPTYVINVGTSLLANLFVYPRYHHYYFGNYYTSRNLGQTIYPWVTVTQQANFYDPLYGYYRTQHRDVAFLQRITRMHTYYASNPNLQPAQTLAMQLRNSSVRQTGDIAMQAVQLQSLVNNRETPLQFVRLQANEQQQLQLAMQPARELRKQRAKAEVQSNTAVAQNATTGAAGENADRPNRGQHNRWRLPTSDNATTLGAAALVAGQQRDGDSNRADRADRGDRAAAADRPAGEDARTPDRRNADRANADRPGADRASADRPGADRPGADRPGADRTGADRTGADRPGADRPGADRPGADRPGADRPGADSAASTPGADVAGRDRPGNDRPGNDRPGSDRAAQAAGVDRPGNDPANADRPGRNRRGSDRPGGDRAGNDIPGANLPGANFPGVNPPGANPRGNDIPGANRRTANRPDLDANGPGADRPGAGNDQPGANRPQGDRPGLDRRTQPGLNQPSLNQPGANQPGGNRLDFDRGASGRPDGRPGRPDAPSVDRPGASRVGGGESRPGLAPPGSSQGSAPSSTPLGGRGRDNRPGGAANGQGAPNGPGAGNGLGSAQDDMRALRDLQRQDAERRRSTPPNVRSLPDRPQPAPGSDRPNPGRGRNSGIVPPGLGSPGAGAPGGGPGARAGGRPGGDANPGRGNKDAPRGDDRKKDKDKK